MTAMSRSEPVRAGKDAESTGTLEVGPAGARAAVERIPGSRIREVANAGMGLPDVIALWYGEPDVPTPEFICKAGMDALAAGKTFYTPNYGIEPLREALAEYASGLHERPVTFERIAVTASGMSAVNLSQQVLTEKGDNLIVTAPIWPNMTATVMTMGGEPRPAQIRFEPDGWKLDLDHLFDQVDGRTRAILVNSPNNPTGWMMSREDQLAVLEFARKRGIWVIADEVYERIVFNGRVAPSFLDIAEPDDRLLVVNSFSKTWAMTGWRLGWITAPAALMPVLEKMIEFHYSCPAHFSQIAGVAAVREGEPFVVEMVERYRRCRDLAVQRLAAMPRVRIHSPQGAFYAFFGVDGMTDSLAFCKRAVAKTQVGLAPGSAFGPMGEGFIRLCFAQTYDRLSQAMDRLEPLLS